MGSSRFKVAWFILSGALFPGLQSAHLVIRPQNILLQEAWKFTSTDFTRCILCHTVPPFGTWESQWNKNNSNFSGLPALGNER